MLVRNYLPEHTKDLPLFVELADDIQRELDLTTAELDDIKEKYLQRGRNNEILLSEFGYDYITTLFKSFGGADSTKLDSFISLIHFLKGTREGLSLILRFIVKSARLVEWWEASGMLDFFGYTNNTGFLTNGRLFSPVITPNTYSFVADLSEAAITDTSLQAFRIFSEKYVLPKLIAMYLTTFIDESRALVHTTTATEDSVVSANNTSLWLINEINACLTNNVAYTTNNVVAHDVVQQVLVVPDPVYQNNTVPGLYTNSSTTLTNDSRFTTNNMVQQVLVPVQQTILQFTDASGIYTNSRLLTNDTSFLTNTYSLASVSNPVANVYQNITVTEFTPSILPCITAIQTNFVTDTVIDTLLLSVSETAAMRDTLAASTAAVLDSASDSTTVTTAVESMISFLQDTYMSTNWSVDTSTNYITNAAAHVTNSTSITAIREHKLQDIVSEFLEAVSSPELVQLGSSTQESNAASVSDLSIESGQVHTYNTSYIDMARILHSDMVTKAVITSADSAALSVVSSDNASTGNSLAVVQQETLTDTGTTASTISSSVDATSSIVSATNTDATSVSGSTTEIAQQEQIASSTASSVTTLATDLHSAAVSDTNTDATSVSSNTVESIQPNQLVELYTDTKPSLAVENSGTILLSEQGTTASTISSSVDATSSIVSATNTDATSVSGSTTEIAQQEQIASSTASSVTTLATEGTAVGLVVEGASTESVFYRAQSEFIVVSTNQSYITTNSNLYSYNAVNIVRDRLYTNAVLISTTVI